MLKFQILKYLKKSQPHTLKICCADKNDNEFYVIDFLLTHDTLENLSLHKFRIEFFCCNITNIYKNLPMKLKKLSLHVSNLRSYVLDKDNCLLQIIEGQASSLRALEMDDHILNTVVFNSFNNLKTLYLNVGRTCTPEIFCINLHPNTSVQSLLVTGDMFNHNNTSKIFALFPEVTTLGLASKSYDHVFPKEVLNIIAGCARKVDKLLLEKVSNSSVILFKFSMLKTIEIKMLEDMTHSGWATLVKNNPTIESLMIESTYGFNDHCLSIIAMKLKNLKHLKLGFGFILTMNSAKTIKKYCKNLKSLVVHKRQIQDNFDFYNALDMKNVHLIITSKLNCAMFHKRCPWYDIESSIEYSSDHPSSSDSDNMFDYDDGSEDDGNELEVIAGYIPG